MNNKMLSLLFSALLCTGGHLLAQNFFFGADLSYENQMENCGVTYQENGVVKDGYQIFADNGCNMVRLRLWHTPSWCDTLNAGKRYSDFQDVRNSIQRAKAQGMQVLLDFHLSDTWADPSHQLCPGAWLGVVNNLPLLQDSLYQYISGTLSALNSEGLLPDMVQIGNETNKGILLSPTVDAAGWSLDWNRNSQLFNTAIQAVRDVETSSGKSIKVALHIAGPSNAGWLMQGFWANGVHDFDVIGLSYYWAWHKPTTIADAGNVVAQLRQLYPGKDVMILETGCIWTTQANDSANNIMNEVNPNYAPASPDNQQRWLVDLTQEMISKGAKGVLYWEPAWVSSSCRTPWGQGSHQENAAFFDFQNNLMANGGIGYLSHAYDNLVATKAPRTAIGLEVSLDNSYRFLDVLVDGYPANRNLTLQLVNMAGSILTTEKFMTGPEKSTTIRLLAPSLDTGIYYATVLDGNALLGSRRIVVQ